MDSSVFMPRPPREVISPGGSLGSSASRPRRRSPKKAFQLLGDAEEYAVKLSEVTVPPPPPEPDTVANTSRDGFPDDVWEAACTAPDGGACVIAAFREVLETRYGATRTRICAHGASGLQEEGA
eukprot:364316-Chlamydomonas_euryale.AAC.11